MSTGLRWTIVLSLIAITTASVLALAGSQPGLNVSRGQLALRGYDAVAYWIHGRPIRGAAEFEHRWNGGLWRFATAANRDTFAKDPSHYAPEFGGYCAWAVSRGYTADGDPNAWRIVDGKLYLNYSKRVQAMWEQDIPGNIAKGRSSTRTGGESA